MIKYFDKITFEILQCAKTEFGHYEDEESLKRTDELVSDGILKDEEWKERSLRFTDEGKEYYIQFMDELQKKHGHQWEKDDDGEINIFAYSSGYCNGPLCERCGYHFCKHCVSEFDIRHCDKDHVRYTEQY